MEFINRQNFSLENNSLRKIFFCIIILAVLNVVIFWNHYFNEVGFPYDFSLFYYGMSAFITSAISEGVFPQWIPFQSMGYPLFLNPQSGIFYPFFWVFTFLGIPYTLQNAIVLQNLHIFAGSVGMFFFLNIIFKSSRYAIIGAIAFQFFGGFYSFSPYPDMIRALAISPWLFYVLTLNVEKPNLSRKVLFIPIVIFVLATGAYPGNFVSIIFIMSLFIILQTINGFRIGFGKKKSIFLGITLFSLLILGGVLSMIHLGPLFQDVEELTRFDELAGQRIQQPFKIQHFAEFFWPQIIPNNVWFDEEYYLGLSILVLASFAPLSSLKKYWVFFTMLIIAFLMALGNDSFFYKFVTYTFPFLGVSRFPSGEYIIFIIIPILIFAIFGLKSIITKKFTLKSFATRLVFIISWFSLGIIFLYYIENPKSEYDYYFLFTVPLLAWKGIDVFYQEMFFEIIFLTIIISAIAFFVILSKKYNFSLKKHNSLSLIPLVFFVGLILFEGFTMINENPRWNLEPFDTYYDDIDFELEKNGKLVTYSTLESLPDQRPVRESKTGYQGGWLGTLDGSYLIGDIAETNFKRSWNVLSVEPYQEFMKMEWTPLFSDLTIENPPSGAVKYITDINHPKNKISLPISTFTNLKSIPKQTSVIQTHYGINEISYQVSLEETKLMVENEIYFPGWTATLIYPEKKVQIHSLEVNDAFRAWILPAGDYEMRANFQFPNFVLFQAITLSTFAIWVLIVIVFWNRLEKNYENE